MAKTKTESELEEEQRLKEEQIAILNQLLANSQSAAIEAADNFVSRKEQAAIRAQRQAWRSERRKLQEELTIDGLRADKLAEVSITCQHIIQSGVEVDGKKYSLTEHDQVEIVAQLAAVKEGAEGVPYHADGELCRIFTAAEFVAVADAAMAHIFYHRTYCNHLNTWIRRAKENELKDITYGVDLPQDLAGNMAALIAAIGG